MYFRLLHDEAKGTTTYLLADLDAAEAVLIDPQAADVPVLAAMLEERALRLRWVLRTHEHDARLPAERRALLALGAPLVQHQAPDAGAGMLSFGDELVRVLATPGHTARCLSFRWRDRLFCGGLLAAGTCPHQARPEAPEAMWESVTTQVFALPPETLLFSRYALDGGSVSNVHEQRLRHPWFAGASRDEFLARVAAAREAPAMVDQDSESRMVRST